MSAPIVVTYSTITEGATRIRGISGDIKSRLDSLKSQVAAVADTWQGDAQAQYQARQDQWTKAQTELCALLDQIAGALDQTALVYQQTESRNTKMWS